MSARAAGLGRFDGGANIMEQDLCCCGVMLVVLLVCLFGQLAMSRHMQCWELFVLATIVNAVVVIATIAWWMWYVDHL
jgi:hypothetical protein